MLNNLLHNIVELLLQNGRCIILGWKCDRGKIRLRLGNIANYFAFCNALYNCILLLYLSDDDCGKCTLHGWDKPNAK